MHPVIIAASCMGVCSPERLLSTWCLASCLQGKLYVGPFSVPEVYCFAAPVAYSPVRLMGELTCCKGQVAWYLIPGHLCPQPPPPLVFYLLPWAASNTFCIPLSESVLAAPECLCLQSQLGKAVPNHSGKGEEPVPQEPSALQDSLARRALSAGLPPLDPGWWTPSWGSTFQAKSLALELSH